MHVNVAREKRNKKITCMQTITHLLFLSCCESSRLSYFRTAEGRFWATETTGKTIQQMHSCRDQHEWQQRENRTAHYRWLKVNSLVEAGSTLFMSPCDVSPAGYTKQFISLSSHWGGTIITAEETPTTDPSVFWGNMQMPFFLPRFKSGEQHCLPWKEEHVTLS